LPPLNRLSLAPEKIMKCFMVFPHIPMKINNCEENFRFKSSVLPPKQG
jgi:hypothetical protein